MRTKPSNTVANRAFRGDGALPANPPPYIGEHGSAAYTRVRNDFPSLRPCDYETLVAYCAAVDRLYAANEALAREGLVVDTPSGPRQSPWATVAGQASTVIGTTSTKLGFSRGQREKAENKSDRPAKHVEVTDNRISMVA